MSEQPRPPSEFGVMLRSLIAMSHPADRFARHLLHQDVNDLWRSAHVHPETVTVWAGSPLIWDMP